MHRRRTPCRVAPGNLLNVFKSAIEFPISVQAGTRFAQTAISPSKKGGRSVVRRSILLFACALVAVDARAQVATRAEQPAQQVSSVAVNTTTDHSQSATARRGADTTTFRSSVDIVALNVVVTDSDQKYVAGLNPSDFAVFEDGVKQDVSFFGASEVPLDLAILLDTSASMTGKMALVQRAAVGFLSTLRSGDRTLIVDIKDATKVLYPLGDDFDAARAAIMSTVPQGGTALYNGAYLTLKELTKQRRAVTEVRRQAVVVLSDGDDTASLISYDDLMEVAKQSGIGIYTIMMRSKYLMTQAAQRGHSYFSQSEFGMKALAQETGARSFFPADVTELPSVYASIAQELATQYALGYSSKNPKQDGSYRRVIVRVTDRPGIRTRTRAGYLAARLSRTAGTN
jgi:Ca-activated chloride channel homolog